MREDKLFQSNNTFIANKSFKKFFVCNKNYYSSQMQKLLADPDAGMQARILKQDYKTTLAVCVIDGKELVIKRYNLKDFWYGLKRAISRSRASCCWRNAHYLQSKKIATAQPIALVENRFGIFRRKAYYIYEYLPGNLAKEIFQTHEVTADLNSNAEKIVNLIEKMLENNISHGDLKDENFIFSEQQVYFIDLDAMRLHQSFKTHNRARLKDIKRFLANWEQGSALYQLFLAKFKVKHTDLNL